MRVEKVNTRLKKEFCQPKLNSSVQEEKIEIVKVKTRLKKEFGG